jgi:hypothetical protein
LLQTRFILGTTIVEISSDEETAMICIAEEGDREHEERCVTLDEKEIDVVIATLNLFKSNLKRN